MTLRTLARMGALALALASSLSSVSAQTAPGAEPSMGCRLFPIACPGPVPAPPPPLLGTPEEQAATTEPAPPPKHMKARAHHRKHAASQQ